MRDHLLQKGKWDRAAPAAADGSHGELLSCGDMVLMSIPEIHIRSDDVDRLAEEACGRRPEAVVFLSRHSAASGIPTLTVHPIGNYGDADFGGRPGALVPPAAHLMTETLREMSSRCGDLDFQVSYEVTHHGPWLETPTMFLEVGSDASRWGDRDAAARLVDSLLSARKAEDGDPVLIGVGGGHYAPQFTEMALQKRASFGHMVPNYALKGIDDEEKLKKVRLAADASGSELIYMHRKSMKRSEARSLQELLESDGMEVLSSRDLESL